MQTSCKNTSSLYATCRTVPFWQFTCCYPTLYYKVPVLLCCGYVDDRFWYFVVILAKHMIYNIVSVIRAARIHWVISVCHCFLVKYFTCVICLRVCSNAHCSGVISAKHWGVWHFIHIILHYFSEFVIVMCDRQLCKTSILSVLSTIMTNVQTAFWAYR